MKATRKLTIRILAAAICCLCLVSAVLAQEQIVTVEATAQPVEALVGDSIRLSIKITAPKDAEIKVPAIEKEIGGLDIKDVQVKDSKKLSGGRILLETDYKLESFTVGTYIIPEQVTKYRLNAEDEFKTAKSSRIFLEIKSVDTKMPDAPKDDIIDIKAQIELREYTLLIAAVAAGILVLAIIVFFIISYKNRKKTPNPAVVVPPHITALDSLEQIQSAGLAVKEYYFRVSKVLRRYIEDRFSIPVTEKTSEEFISDMTRSTVVPDESKTMLKSYLQHCDRVKFAKYDPSTEEMQNIYVSAKDFINRTKEEEKEEDNK